MIKKKRLTIEEYLMEHSRKELLMKVKVWMRQSAPDP